MSTTANTDTRPQQVGQHVPMDDVAAALNRICQAGLTLDSATRSYRREGYDVVVYTHGADEFATAARLLAGLGGIGLRSTGTTVEKRAGDHGMELHADHGTCHVRVLDLSSEVCKRVLVGTDVVEEQVPDPAWEGEVPMVTVTREVPRYEVVCPPSVLALADRSDETVAVSA